MFAQWSANTYTLTYSAANGGYISGTTPQTVAYLTSGTQVTAVASNAYVFTSWSDGVSTAARTDTALVGGTNVTANFRAVPEASVMTVIYTAGLPAVIALSDLATNWSDLDGDTVELTAISLTTTNGVALFPINLTTNLDGSYVITNTAFLGYNNSNNVNDQFSYSISDGFGGTNIGYVNLVVVLSVTGTNSIVGIGTGNPTTLTAYGIPGYTYITERATNLAPAVWVDIATNTAATNGVINATDTFWDLGGHPPGSAFYQLKWRQP